MTKMRSVGMETLKNIYSWTRFRWSKIWVLSGVTSKCARTDRFFYLFFKQKLKLSHFSVLPGKEKKNWTGSTKWWLAKGVIDFTLSSCAFCPGSITRVLRHMFTFDLFKLRAEDDRDVTYRGVPRVTVSISKVPCVTQTWCARLFPLLWAVIQHSV